MSKSQEQKEKLSMIQSNLLFLIFFWITICLIQGAALQSDSIMDVTWNCTPLKLKLQWQENNKNCLIAMETITFSNKNGIFPF